MSLVEKGWVRPMDVACPYCQARPQQACFDMRSPFAREDQHHTINPHEERIAASGLIEKLIKGTVDARRVRVT